MGPGLLGRGLGLRRGGGRQRRPFLELHPARPRRGEPVAAAATPGERRPALGNAAGRGAPPLCWAPRGGGGGGIGGGWVGGGPSAAAGLRVPRASTGSNFPGPLPRRQEWGRRGLALLPGEGGPGRGGGRRRCAGLADVAGGGRLCSGRGPAAPRRSHRPVLGGDVWHTCAEAASVTGRRAQEAGGRGGGGRTPLSASGLGGRAELPCPGACRYRGAGARPARLWYPAPTRLLRRPGSCPGPLGAWKCPCSR